MPVFDLRELAEADAAWKRPGLVYTATFLVLVALELAAVVASAGGVPFGSLSSTGLVDAGLTLGLLGVLAFGLLAIRRAFGGADRLVVDATGVRLEYRGRERETYRWESGPAFWLRDYRGDPDSVRAQRGLRLQGARYWSRRTLLTDPAFDAILREARRRGTSIEAHPVPGSSSVAYRLVPGTRR